MHVFASQQLIWGCGKALSSFQKESLAQGHRAESEEASGRLWSNGNRAGGVGRGKQREVQIRVAPLPSLGDHGDHHFVFP